MNANEVIFQIRPSGTRGTKVVKLTMGREKMVACYRGADAKQNLVRCLQWLLRCSTNEAQADNAREAAKVALRQRLTTAGERGTRVDTTLARAAGLNYADHAEGQLCLRCAADYDLQGEVTLSASGWCYNCEPQEGAKVELVHADEPNTLSRGRAMDEADAAQTWEADRALDLGQLRYLERLLEASIAREKRAIGSGSAFHASTVQRRLDGVRAELARREPMPDDLVDDLIDRAIARKHGVTL